MSAAIALARHSLRRIGTIVAGLAIVLAGFQFLLTQVAVYLQRNNAFGLLSSLIPDFVRSLAGPAMIAFMSSSGVVSLGYFHPIVLAALVALAIAIATEPAAEVEMRFVDLTLARPVARAALVTRTLIVLAVTATVVFGMMAAGTSIGLACCAPPAMPRPSPRVVASLVVSLGSVAWCWAGIALAASAWVRRRATASGMTGVAALAAYLLDYLGRVWSPALSASRLSPFHYFEPMTIVAGAGLSGRNVAVLLAAGVAGTAVSYFGYSRRDL